MPRIDHPHRSAHRSAMMALAVGSMFTLACKQQETATATPDDTATPDLAIKCFGINECSGQSACDVPDGRVAEGSVGHACAGQNECKGKGWVKLKTSECDAQGGEPL